MKTLEQIMQPRGSKCLDGRDLSRLLDFIPMEKWGDLGFSLKEETNAPIGVPTPVEFTEAEVLKRLERDLDFAFEKALHRRGISASMMFEVIKMWMWVLDDPLAEWADHDYAQYGLPLFKAVAVKYGFENPIGDNDGTENEYSDDY